MLVGAGLTGLGLWWAIHVAMWFLAVASVITVGQRMWSIAQSPGARDLIPIASEPADTEPAEAENGDAEPSSGSDGQTPPAGQR